MFDLPENQREFYYQQYLGEAPATDAEGNLTGRKIPSYSSPIKAKAMISENTSDVTHAPFGKDLTYDRMISTVQDLPIDEHSKLYIDVSPSEEPDYEVVRVSKGIYQKVWAIRKIDGYEDN